MAKSINKKDGFSKERPKLQPRPKFYAAVANPAPKPPSTPRKRINEDSSGRPRRTFGEEKPRFDKDRGERKPFSRDNNDERPRRAFGEERPKFDKDRGERKPFSRDNNDERPRRTFGEERPKFDKDRGERKPFSRDNNDERPRRAFSDEKPKFDKDRGERKPFSRDNNDERPRRAFSDEKPKFDKDRGERKPFSRDNNDERPRRAFSDEKPRTSNDRPDRRGTKKDEERFWKDDFSKKPFISDEKPKLRRIMGDEKIIAAHKKKEQTTKDDDDMRLNKYVALCGVASRRASGEIIKNGEILVNDEVITEPGRRILPEDVVTYKGEKLIISASLVYLLMNKPKGFITTMSDELDRKTVMDLIDHDMSERIYPVGRLDRDTSGLLLFTNDGDLAKKLTHPSHKVKKLYHATLDKPITKNDLEDIAKGLVLEDGVAVVDGISVIDTASKKEVGIEIHIGKNRIVRRIFEHKGYVVEKLDRVYYGGLTKKDLPRGRYRHLTEREIIMLKHFV
jgi:23S rRNA pseudouridine2605 synthase